LEDLATEPDEDITEFLAVEDEVPAAAWGEYAPEVEAAEDGTPDDPLEGMTDDEIAYAQAHGQLTGEQELAWLKRQAARLAEARAGEEAVEEMAAQDVAPAQPAEALPDWLQGMRPDESGTVDEGELAVAEAETGAESFDWIEDLGEGDVLETEDLSAPSAELTLEGDLSTLWPAEDESEGAAEALPLVESELEAFLNQGLVPEETDPLAEALDAEYERELAGDESEPEWYAQAVETVSLEGAGAPAAEIAELEAEAVLAEAAVVEDMPDWLLPRSETEAVAAAASEGVAESLDWLAETADEAAIATGEAVPDWLVEEAGVEAAVDVEQGWLDALEQHQDEGEVDWLAEEPRVPEPAVARSVPAARVEQEIAPRVEPRPIPAGELFETYKGNLDQNPDDHVSRLALARALRTNREVIASLDQYETLIESSQLLQDVTDDLSSVVEEQTEMPRAHRLLGDVFVRRGMLREALDAYRSALDQL